MINWEIYDEKVDIWSVGCIMAELLLFEPLFPGNNHQDQMELIISFTGTPKQEELEKLCDESIFVANGYFIQIYFNDLTPFFQVHVSSLTRWTKFLHQI